MPADSGFSARGREPMPADSSPIRILTADDHALLRQGIAALVSGESDMKLVAEASNGQDAIEKFRLHRPDVTLMDLQMPALNGIEAIIGIRSEFPNHRPDHVHRRCPGVAGSESGRPGLHIEGTRA